MSKRLKSRISMLLAVILVFSMLPFSSFGSVFAQASLIANHSFEQDLDSWQTNGSEAISTPESSWLPENGGKKLLNYWANQAYKADTFQTVTGVENGSYLLKVWVANTGSFNDSHIYAKQVEGAEVKKTIPATSGNWTQMELPVEVVDEQVTVGIYTDANADAWLGADLVTLVKTGGESTPESEDFIYGVDVSTLSKVEDFGGTFYDQGVEKGALDILTSYGSNYARLKLWEDAVDVYSNGIAYNDLDDTIRKAKQIKDADMKFLLNFHYSGFWADPGRQDKPESWKGMTFEELTQAVYDHTKESIEALVAAGAAPDMVQIGNEIRPGMLFPDGRISSENGGYGNLAILLNSGIQAVRDTLGQDVDIMLHLDQGGKNGIFRTWFDGIIAAGVTDFQIIGASYYPYWHGTLAELQHNLNDVSQRYNRDVVVVETAYAFTLDDHDGHANIFNRTHEGISGYPATVEGQAKFLYDVMEVVRNVPNNRGLGIFYWEPAWLGVEGAGWTAGEGNAWENQAMFDFEGNALQSLNVFTKGYVPPEPTPRDEAGEDETLRGLTLLSLNKPATASSSAGLGGGIPNAPENAVDNNDLTSWGTDQGTGSWWQVDLEEVVAIDRILMEFWDGVREITIELSDEGETYTMLATHTVTSGQMNLELPEDTKARYVRVTITEATSAWVGFMYFKAYGNDNLVQNHSFEQDLEHWETNGHAAIRVEEDSWLPENGGTKRLNYWAEGAYIADTFQTLTGLRDGSYTLKAWVANTGNFNESETYMYAKLSDGETVKTGIPMTGGGWSQIELLVEVTGGELKVGFHADAQGGAWLGTDLVTLVRVGGGEENGETPGTPEPLEPSEPEAPLKDKKEKEDKEQKKAEKEERKADKKAEKEERKSHKGCLTPTALMR
ncbi:glycosyl hydrolase 53 family protein [Halalkalibacter akibai]|uniref:Arabinogalactan endo-beta-1,4-galactanase n=1 Tax=Halalkalibacter akibai (strain ATCC 43226 / DSM 21942 / CIP 109018 / JCM 9157 / 1139) TaxID=1236973 RepID=W4QNR5_HALA3|nr:glycosyl hydrolase 53 family protein [Halalkalibacter akibai]GAE33755.1 putative galactosidase [Halalkalibacter akibai JCM 9157]